MLSSVNFATAPAAAGAWSGSWLSLLLRMAAQEGTSRGVATLGHVGSLRNSKGGARCGQVGSLRKGHGGGGVSTFTNCADCGPGRDLPGGGQVGVGGVTAQDERQGGGAEKHGDGGRHMCATGLQGEGGH